MTITEHEHARYKKALNDIAFEYSDQPRMAAYKMADAALNPPPPPPVTLADILATMKTFRDKRNYAPTIEIFTDESAIVKVPGSTRVFVSLQDAVNFLNL